jgi:hypothetical protein
VVAEKGAGGTGFGEDPAKVGIAGLVLDIEEDGAGEGGGAVGCGGDLSAEDGVESRLPGGEEEFDGGMEVRIGETDGGKAEFYCPGDDGPHRKKGVVEAVVGPDVERGVGGHTLLYKCIITLPEEPQAGFGWANQGGWEKVES